MSDLYVWAKRTEFHTTPETMGMRCDKCPNLSARKVDGAKLHPYRYYCEARHMNMDLRDMYAIKQDECPIHRALGRRQ